MEGKFIVVEGMHGAGKTSMIKEALKELKDYEYSKGFTEVTPLNRYLKAHPHSITFYLNFIMKTKNKIKPILKKGDNVLQDRYIQSVDSFFPDCEYLHNKLARKILNRLFLVPDLYIYATANPEEIALRLKKDSRDDYRLGLASNFQKIIEREKRYEEIYEAMDCPKRMIDTTGKSIEETGKELVEIIKKHFGGLGH